MQNNPKRQQEVLLPGGQGAQRADGHGVRGSLPAHVLKGHGQRAVFVQQVVRHHHGERSGHAEVRHEADEERGHDPDGDGPLGVLHLLSYGEETQPGDVRGSSSSCEMVIRSMGFLSPVVAMQSNPMKA